MNYLVCFITKVNHLCKKIGFGRRRYRRGRTLSTSTARARNSAVAELREALDCAPADVRDWAPAEAAREPGRIEGDRGVCARGALDRIAKKSPPERARARGEGHRVWKKREQEILQGKGQLRGDTQTGVVRARR